MGMLRELKEGIKALKSLLVGLSVTGDNFTKKLVTVHYPRKTVDTTPSWRGHVELVPKDGASACIACGTCARACPSECISVQGEKGYAEDIERASHPAAYFVDRLIPDGRKMQPERKQSFQRPSAFDLDFTLCSLCGTCVEVCPVDALRFSDNVYLAGYMAKEYRFDLLSRLQKKAAADRPDGRTS
jgi:NADH-quinone oxidoreductase subunit I